MQEISFESIFEVSDHGYGGITLNMWFDIWLEVYKRDRIKQTTIDTYKALYDRHLRYSIGSHDMREFKPLHIRKLYNDFLKTGYSAKYLNTLHTMLNNMFKTAVSNEIVNTNPCSDIERPVCKSHERRVLSVDEQKRLCAQIRQPRFLYIEPLITTLLGTGLRIGELLGLRWSDVYLPTEPKCRAEDDIPRITVSHTLVRVSNEAGSGTHFYLQSPKTRASVRAIPLQIGVADAIRRQRHIVDKNSQGQDWSPLPGFEDLVFCGKRGQPQWRTSVVSAIDTVVRSINEDDRDEPHMERILPHAFRHTFATRCLEAGIPPKVVQKWLGHASINMTLDLYTHVSEDLSAQHMYTLEKCMGWGEDV